MSDQSLNIFSLNIAIKLLTGKTNLESLKPAEISFISKAHNLFLSYYSTIHSGIDCPSVYEDFEFFVENKDLNDLQTIADFLSSPKESKGEDQPKEIKKEDSSIPVELESMVDIYKNHQADLLDSNKPLTVADTVLRARKAWAEREKYRLIYENADKEQQKQLDEQKEKFYRQAIDPKQESRDSITRNTRYLAKYSLALELGNRTSQFTAKEYNEAVDRIVYLAETGSIDVSNINDLYTVSTLVVKDFLNTKTELDQIDTLVQKQLEEQESDPNSDKLDKYKKELSFADQEAENQYREKSQSYVEKFRQEKDYDLLLDNSQKEVGNILDKLSKAIPNAKSPFEQVDPLTQKASELEALIRKTNPTALNINPVGLGAKTSAVLKETGGKNLNANLVDLYSKGLTPEKYNALTKDEKSPLSKYLAKNPNLRKQIENGLKKYSQSPDGKKIAEQLNKIRPLSNFESRLPLAFQKALHPQKTIESFINKKIGQYAGKQIVNNSSSALGKKLGKYILDDGLKLGAKKFADEVAKKLLVAGAKKLGIEAAKVAGMAAAESALAAASVALGISTAGLSLILEAVVFVVVQVSSFAYKKFKELYADVFGEEFDAKKAMGAVALGGAAIWGTLAIAGKGVKAFGTATKAAAISAVGAIWLSIVVIAIFLTLTFLVAPIISTIVQFDSVEKVQYDEFNASTSGDCAWPISGNYQVIEGPLGGTHSLSNLQAIDIWGPDIDGKPMLSVTEGDVISASVYSNYGNTVQIQTNNSAGSFVVLYGHMSYMRVKTGQHVRQGEVLGRVGGSGGWDPHIHLEYQGIEYNRCPAGGKKIRERCVGFIECGSIYTN